MMKVKRSTQVLLILGLAVSMLAMSAVTCLAYPTGWSSDVIIPGVSGVNAVDIAAKDANLHVVYTRTDKRVYYVRSNDRGVSWTSPVRVDLGNQTDGDKYVCIATGAGNNVYIGYVSKERAGSETWESLFLRSQNNGGSWNPSYFAYSSPPNASCPIIDLASTRTPTDNPAFVYTRQDGEGVWTRETYWRKVENDGQMSAEMQASVSEVGPGDRYDSFYPRIDTDGTSYFIIWAENDPYLDPPNPGWHLWQIVCDRWDGVDNRDVLDFTDTSGEYLEYPDIAKGPGNTFYASWLDRGPANWRVMGRKYEGGWLGFAYMDQGTLANPSYPKVLTGTLDVVYRSTTDTTKVDQFGLPDLMLNCYPRDGDRSLATSVNTHPYLAVLSTSGQVRVKRIDTVEPSGTITTNGNNYEDRMFVKARFDIIFNNVIDDWNVTGTDPLGDSFTNGVTSIEIQFSTNGIAWLPLGTLHNTPWEAETSSEWEDGVYWLRGKIEDTAGNEYTSASQKIEVDGVRPTCSLATDTTPNAEGWRNKTTKITISGSDNRVLDCVEYRKRKGLGAWTPWTTGTSLTLSDGEWWIEARSKDKAGNYSATKSEQLDIDTTKPTVSITKPSTDTVTASTDGTVYVAAESSDNLSGAVWTALYIDGKQFSDSNGDSTGHFWNTSGLDDGTYTIEARSRDKAGNTVKTSKQITLITRETAYYDSYFAEGTTRNGFDEFICVMNPNDEEANLDINFYLENGEVKNKKITVPSTTRTTINVADVVGSGHDVSTKIHADSLVICERPMYFNYRGKWSGGHTAPARNTLQSNFYFAEGCTRNGFETWLTLQNPNDKAANVTATYMLGDGQTINKTYNVPATTRSTVSVNSEVGPDKDVSIKVESNRPIAAERPVYFDYYGRTGGHDVIGTTSPSKTWYFAEGCTRNGFDTYYCIQNPNGEKAAITVAYSTGQTKKYTVKSNARFTVNVNDDVGLDKDVAATITSTVPVIAERPMYFDHNGIKGGSNVLGATPINKGTTTYYLAEGTTRDGFDEFITIANLYENSGPKIYLDYVLDNGEEIHRFPHNSDCPFFTVPNGGRVTINVRDDIGPNKDFSIRISSEQPVIVERPMYFDYKGETGGHVGTPFTAQ